MTDVINEVVLGSFWSSFRVTTFLCNEHVFQHDTIFFLQRSAVRGLRLWHVLNENCGANV